MLSNQLGRPVTMLWRYDTIGPYRSLLDCLGGSGFRAARPRVIIWLLREQDLEHGSGHAARGADAMPPAAFLAQLGRALGR